MTLIKLSPRLTETEINAIRAGDIGLIKNRDPERVGIIYTGKRKRQPLDLTTQAIVFELDENPLRDQYLVASGVFAMDIQKSHQSTIPTNWRNLSEYKEIWIQRQPFLKESVDLIRPAEFFLSAETERLYRLKENLGSYNLRTLQALIKARS